MKKSAWILVLFLLSKFILSALIPLIGDEAYYWVWSQRMQLSFFDHPPFVAWLFWLSKFGSTILGPRWVSLAMATGTLALWIPIAKRLFPDEKSTTTWILLLAISPMIGFGSLLVTPDVPLFFFWSLSTWLLFRILEKQRSLDYAMLGLSLGLGFCAKYHIVLWPLSVAVFLFLSNNWNLVQRKKILLTIIFGFIFCSPVLIWNAQNAWASFRFQIDHGLNQGPWDWHWSGDYILGQFCLLLPLPLFRSFYKQGPLIRGQFLHLCLGWVPLSFFLLSSMKGPVEANWPLMAFAHLGIVFFSQFPKSKWIQFYVYFWSSITVVVLYCTIFPQHNFLHPKLSEPKKYSENVSLLSSYRPLFTSTYQMASSIWYLTKTPTFKLKGQSRYDYFDEMAESTPAVDHFYFLKENYQELPQGYNFHEVLRPFDEHTLYEVSK